MIRNIAVTFVLHSKGTLECNSSSIASVLVLNRTSPSLILHIFVVDTLLNLPLPFNVPVILSYTNTSRVNVLGRLLMHPICLLYVGESQSTSEANNSGLQTQQCPIGQVAGNPCRGRVNTERTVN